MANSKDSIFKSKSDAGKGDKPRNTSKKFYENFDEIKWKSKQNNEKRNEG
jgi:hypothetical protein